MRHPHFLWSLYWNLSHWSLTPCKKHMQTYTRANAHTCLNPELHSAWASLKILALVGETWWAVRGIGPMPLGNRLSWVELRQGDKKRGKQKDRQKKVAIWIDRPQGHMVESQTGWCSAAPCLCCQPQKLMSLHWNGWGLSPENCSNRKVCLILACFGKKKYSNYLAS